MKDPYSILECSSKASKEEIIKKYRSLALKYHPDRTRSLDINERNEAEEKFKKISCAFSFLEKHNFKYSHKDANFEEFTSQFGAFSSNFGKIGNLFNSIRNMNLDSIASNILKEVNNIQDFYNGENEALERSLDININARVDLMDIFNNVTKEISIKCVKKCKECMGLGYDINTKKRCMSCNGLKIREEDVPLKFESYLKTRQLVKHGNEELGKRPGDININILPQKNSHFRIIDDYNILYKIELTTNMIVKSEDKLIINHEFEYLDLKIRNLKITNPKTELIYEYEIINEGLLYPNKTRGNLIILLIDKLNLISENLNNENNGTNNKNYKELHDVKLELILNGSN